MGKRVKKLAKIKSAAAAVAKTAACETLPHKQLCLKK